MFNFKKNNNRETGFWFKEIVNDTEHISRICGVLNIKEYLLRKHKVLSRPNFDFKNEKYISAKIVLNIISSVINTHVSYLMGNPVSLNGNANIVSEVNRIYKQGNYNKTDYEIAKDLYTYNNAFEYIYKNKNNHIQSKIISNEDSYPVYDDEGNYTHFIEYWKDANSFDEHYVVYYPHKVETYINDKLTDEKINLSGLPIHYSGLSKSAYKQYGEPFVNDLFPLTDAIEQLVSKLDDSVTVHSLNPLGIVTGKQIKSSVPKEMVGAVLNLDDGNEFKFATAAIDYQSVKLLLDTLWQQFFAVACVPALHFGQVSVSNVSETSLRFLYAKLDDKARETMITFKEGVLKRFEVFRKLLLAEGKEFSDSDFCTLDFNFNVNRPVDTISLMNELSLQRNMGAISLQTIVDKSPSSIDTALEMERIRTERDEGILSGIIIPNYPKPKNE
ncbi:MAG: phage portal protein [Oscillospiraceae bacterium]|nr:phage portal protein [Oscillospiraceae bacterium]